MIASCCKYDLHDLQASRRVSAVLLSSMAAAASPSGGFGLALLRGNSLLSNERQDDPVTFDGEEWQLSTVLGTGTSSTVFAARKTGQVLFMSSLGAYAPATNAFMMPYLASKAAINQFGGGLRTVMKKYNVGVSVACLGMVESELTMKQLQQYVLRLLVR